MAPIFTGSKFGFGRSADSAAVFSATGGTKTTVGSYTYHTFYVSVASPYPSTTDLTSSFITNQSLTVDYLLIGGGGAGGGTTSGQVGAGGGGAGAVIYKTSVPLSAGTYPVTVGRGGEASPSTTNGSSVNKGGSTIFNGLTAEGGGYGGRSNNGNNGQGQAGGPGGSGGGGGAEWSPPATNPVGGTASGSSAYPGSGTDIVTPPVGWGRNGGTGAFDNSNLSGGGGGGGANLVGGNGVSVGSGGAGGAGGAGATYTVLLNSGTTAANNVAGGGGGGSYQGNSGAGGSGGGGSNPNSPGNWPTPSLIYPTTQPTLQGQDGYGGGGAGGSYTNTVASISYISSQRGGCGFLQIRYLTP